MTRDLLMILGALLAATTTAACGDDVTPVQESKTNGEASGGASGGTSAQPTPNSGGAMAGTGGASVAEGGAPDNEPWNGGSCDQCLLTPQVTVRAPDEDPVVLSEVPLDSSGAYVAAHPNGSPRDCSDKIQFNRFDCKSSYGSLYAAQATESRLPGLGGAPSALSDATLSIRCKRHYDTTTQPVLSTVGCGGTYVDPQGTDWTLTLDESESLPIDLLDYDSGDEFERTMRFVGSDDQGHSRSFSIEIAACATYGAVCAI